MMFDKLLIPFFYVFSFAVKGVQILNIVYAIKILALFLLKERKIILDWRLFFIFVYIALCFTSFFLYAFNNESDILRNAIKVIFIFNMAIFMAPFLIIKESFEEHVFIFSVCLACLILFAYAFFLISDVDWLTQSAKAWGGGTFPSWPNSIAIPLLLAFWIGLKKSKNPVFLLAISAGIVLTFSRAALLAMIALLLTVFIFRYKASVIRVILNPVFMLALLGSLYGYFHYAGLMGKSYTYVGDRVDIFFYTMSYIQQKPYFGFGGSTLEQLYSSAYLNYEPLLLWPHTHNFILENTLRYGLLSTIFLLMFLAQIFFHIKDIQDKIVFIIFLSLSLFQTHFQEFVYLLTLAYIANRNVLAKG